MFSSLKRGFSYDERAGVRISKDSISRPIPPERDWAASLPDSSYLQRAPTSKGRPRPGHSRNNSEPVPIAPRIAIPFRRALSLKVIVKQTFNKPLPPTPIEDLPEGDDKGIFNVEAYSNQRGPAVIDSELAVKAASDILQEVIGDQDAVLQYSPSEYEEDADAASRANLSPIVSPVSISGKAPSAWKARLDSTQQEAFIKRLSNRLSGLNFQFEFINSSSSTIVSSNPTECGPNEEPDVPVDVDIVLKVLREDNNEPGRDTKLYFRDEPAEMRLEDTDKAERRLTVGRRNTLPTTKEEREALGARRRGVTFNDSPADEVSNDGVFGAMDE